MSDLIDRQAAIDELHMHLMYRMGTESNKQRLDAWIKNLPSAQPEIVRCKDCKHWEGERRGYFYYFEQCSLHECTASSDDFCSWAERRTG